MENEVFLQTKKIEDTHWWFINHQKLVKQHVSLKNGDLLLDVGCGTGKILTLFPLQKVVGVDINPVALSICKEKHIPQLIQADAISLPFKTSTFSYVLILQVLNHQRAKDEKKILREIWRVLKPGGKVLITEPAFEILRRTHDVVEHTKKRFKRGELKDLVKSAGFIVKKCSYIYSYAFFPILLSKFFRRQQSVGDLFQFPFFLNYFFKLLSFLSLPFGSSVFLLAEKQG